MRANVRDAAIDYLALGLDPKRSAFFRQSDVPEVTELAWLLSATTGKGLLERAHSYKDKVAKGLDASMGLFYYPVLMAADILIFRSNLVPVGQDQVQHIEMAQDMAQSWNHAYKTDWLVRPEPRLSSTPRVVGVDGEKMSKSYKNTIELQMEGKALKKVVMSIKTDSTPVEEPKNPDTCNVFSLYTLFATPEERDALAGATARAAWATARPSSRCWRRSRPTSRPTARAAPSSSPTPPRSTRCCATERRRPARWRR